MKALGRPGLDLPLGSARRPSVCFVAPNNYALLAQRPDLHKIGGAEVQRALIARELQRRGHAVSFVVWDHGQPDGVEHDGVRVFKMCPPEAGWPVLRFVHPRWTSLRAAMDRADADVYYMRTAGAETGQVAHWCRQRRRGFVLAIANDPECDWRLGGKKALRERWLYYYGLRRAGQIIAQTTAQQESLRTHFGIESTLIRSCAPDPLDGGGALATPDRLQHSHVLWAGRFSRQKRLAWVVPIAQRCPQVHFDVVGSGSLDLPEVAAAVRDLQALPNVTLHGFVPHAQMGALHDRAALLLSTSAWEGYPNVFLEAWSRGVPTVSTLDPDGVVEGNDLGRIAPSVESLATCLSGLLTDRSAWARCSRACRSFFLQHHTVTATVDGLVPLLQVVIPIRG